MASRKVSQLFFESPLVDLPSWQYFDLQDPFRLVAQHLRTERILRTFCESMGFPKEPADYQQRDEKQEAVQMSLFHALFVSWPKHFFTILDIGATLPQWEKPDEEVYLHLKHVFEERRKYSQQEMWQRQAQQASALLTAGNTTRM